MKKIVYIEVLLSNLMVFAGLAGDSHSNGLLWTTMNVTPKVSPTDIEPSLAEPAQSVQVNGTQRSYNNSPHII